MVLPEHATDAATEALEGVSEWVLIVGADGVVRRANRAFQEFTGATGPGGVPWEIGRLFPGDEPEIRDDICEVIGSGRIRTGILSRVQGHDGAKKVMSFTLLPRRDADGGCSAVFLCGCDITDAIEMEQFRKDAYTQIEKNIEQFAILGDELRNPLTAIIGLCDLLEDTATAAKISARAREIDALITRIDRGWIDSEKVRKIIKKYYDIGAAGTHELVAQAIHEEYRELQERAGETPETNPSMRPWSELPRRLKESNLRQAADIWKALHEIDCVIGISTGGAEPLFSFTDSQTEYLAEKEHGRWVEERVRKGWKYGKTRDDQQRIHDCIVPWNELPEAQREKDRNAVRVLPAILAKVYLTIIRTDDNKNNNIS